MVDRKIRELELLAPARNKDIGIAAIGCGADAVYIAGPQFGARQAAGNSIDDIRELCRYAHLYGARIFITLNTILYDTELEAARQQMEAVWQAGADALIVQDLAVLKIAEAIRKDGFSLPLHASTQCAIRTPAQARFYEDLGFSRLILERELSLEQIRAIREAVDCELECFVHGALCVCYSGQCYMSEAITGRSANRGACAQACRSLYDLEDGAGRTLMKDKALLSLKDLNLKDRLSDLAQTGITSFKIEGRLKNISYVKNIVRDYSLALDRITNSSGGAFCRSSYGKVYGGFVPAPDKTFNRGYTQLFIDGRRGKWSTFDSAKGMGEEIGTVSYISPERNVLRVRPATHVSGDRSGSLKLNNGDGFSFVSRRSEVIGFRADVCNGTEIRCKPVPEIFIGARLFRNIDTAFEKEIDNNPPEREIRVAVELCIRNSGDKFTISAQAESEDGRNARYISDAGTQEARNRERMESLFTLQLGKSTRHYRFEVKRILCDNDCPLPLMSISAINGIRRELAQALDREPCRNRPLLNRTDLVRGSTEHLPFPSSISYKANVANSLARQVYTGAGAADVESAFELTHRQNIELMRTRYCIRHETGLCPKQTGKGPATDLYLVNNGRRFTLHFDCRECEMAVLTDSRGSRK